MKISNNVAGNYNPYSINSITQKPASKEKIIVAQDKINLEEKNFFAKLYPEKKTEIIDYHFYQRTGEMKGVSLGSLLDRRG